ncbi:hypothetical protein GQ607_000185 [Colletotrichum asianum]|uniref:Uncharacterized protein n=1 Tax=Colletotrichum asianum TaxID=702518 RepID=A0A8H3ZTN5_9PEZI|nr:hypothetical protein GQ607_000185 [Colletotrichum asianum]
MPSGTNGIAPNGPLARDTRRHLDQTPRACEDNARPTASSSSSCCLSLDQAGQRVLGTTDYDPCRSWTWASCSAVIRRLGHNSAAIWQVPPAPACPNFQLGCRQTAA